MSVRRSVAGQLDHFWQGASLWSPPVWGLVGVMTLCVAGWAFFSITRVWGDVGSPMRLKLSFLVFVPLWQYVMVWDIRRRVGPVASTLADELPGTRMSVGAALAARLAVLMLAWLFVVLVLLDLVSRAPYQ